MNLFIETVCLIFFLIYDTLVSIFKFFIPVKFLEKSIDGETVLITGAGSGIGRLLAIRLSNLGCRLVFWDINEEGMAETSKLCSKAGKIFIFKCDLSNRNEIYDTYKKVKNDVGKVDILINNAGIVTGKKYLECPDSLIEKTMKVNIMAHFWTVKCFLPDMVQYNHGHVVTIASAAGITGCVGLADYCASKFAAVGFDESLRFELEATPECKVNTTVVCPFYINTGMFHGVQSRFPSLFPIIDPEYAADKIMTAILTNQKILYIPRLLYFVFALKGILPCRSACKLMDYFGASSAMDKFVGRK